MEVPVKVGIRRLKMARALFARTGSSPRNRFILLFIGAFALTAWGQQAEIWFGPFDNIQRPWLNYIGPADYQQLFAPAAPWAVASSKTTVFETQAYNILNMSAADLKNMMSDLAQRHLKLAVDIEAIPYDGTCGSGYEGFGDLESLRSVASLISAAGGTWDIAAMDEPFWDASIDTGPNPAGATGAGTNACLWTPGQVAAKVAQSVELLRELVPNIVIGDMEPITDASNQTYGFPALAGQYASWMDAYLNATGTPLAFFHADVSWGYSDSFTNILQVRDVVRARLIPFGIMYDGYGTPTPDNGSSQPASDAQWMQWAEQNATQFELQTGYTPDHAVIISWTQFPNHVVPETDPGTHTYLIDYYARTRTRLDVNKARNRNQLTGALFSVPGSSTSPIASASIQATATALDGPGLVSQATYAGVVPSFAQYAIVGLRVNEECSDCAATVDLNLRNFAYSEGSGQNLVPNADFGSGLQNWGIGGTATATLGVDPQTGSPEVYIASTPAQSLLVNSTAFPVTAGANYQVSWTSQVAPPSQGGGYFTLIFLANSSATGESTRVEWPFVTATVSLGSTTTAADGSYIMPIPVLSANALRVELSYAGVLPATNMNGMNNLWPALATVDIGIPTRPRH